MRSNTRFNRQAREVRDVLAKPLMKLADRDHPQETVMVRFVMGFPDDQKPKMLDVLMTPAEMMELGVSLQETARNAIARSGAL